MTLEKRRKTPSIITTIHYRIVLYTNKGSMFSPRSSTRAIELLEPPSNDKAGVANLPSPGRQKSPLIQDSRYPQNIHGRDRAFVSRYHSAATRVSRARKIRSSCCTLSPTAHMWAQDRRNARLTRLQTGSNLDLYLS